MVNWEGIRREPFRLLFPLAILFGLSGVGQWLAYALGGRDAFGFTHAWIQMSLHLSSFIAGFLLTALPRFATSFPASTAELAAVLSSLAGQWLFASRRMWGAAGACFIGFCLLLALFAGRRFASRRAPEVQPPVEFVWIPLALLHGVAGAGLVLLGTSVPALSWLFSTGRPMAGQGFVLGMVIGVAGFMAPRLMGHAVSTFGSPSLKGRTQARGWSRLHRVLLHGIAGFFFFVSFWIEGAGAVRAAYLLRAMVVTAEFIGTTRCHRLPRTEAQYIRLLWISLWMIQFGLWGAGLFPRYRVGMLHLMFLGGFSLMTFALGTMVVFSHAGQREWLQRPLRTLRLISACLALSVVARLAADVVPRWFFPLLGLASASWILSALSWLILVLPHVVRTVPAEAFERMHEEAKQTLLRRHRQDFRQR